MTYVKEVPLSQPAVPPTNKRKHAGDDDGANIAADTPAIDATATTPTPHGTATSATSAKRPHTSGSVGSGAVSIFDYKPIGENAGSTRVLHEYNPRLPTRATTAATTAMPSLPYHVSAVSEAGSDRMAFFDSRTGQTTSALPEPAREDSDTPSVVHIFDLDETLIQFNYLSTGVYAKTTGHNAAIGEKIGKYFEKMVFDMAEKHFFFDDLERCNQTNVRDLTDVDDGRPLGDHAFGADGFAWPDGIVPGGCLSVDLLA